MIDWAYFIVTHRTYQTIINNNIYHIVVFHGKVSNNNRINFRLCDNIYNMHVYPRLITI
jgi:hypothetical protein